MARHCTSTYSVAFNFCENNMNFGYGMPLDGITDCQWREDKTMQT